jgi:hypothetical protein
VDQRWLVEISGRDDVKTVIGAQPTADLNIEFNRLITYSEQATVRRKYETTIASILRNFRTDVVIPLKRSRNAAVAIAAAPQPTTSRPQTTLYSSVSPSTQTTRQLILP